jgi:hypothetical protein
MSSKGTKLSLKTSRSDGGALRSDIGVLRLNERDKELILLLFDNQAMSRGQIETRFFGSTPRCNSRLKKLLDAGYIVRHAATDLPGISLQGLQAIYTPGKASFPIISVAKDLPLAEVRKLCRSDCTPLYLTHALHAAHFRQLVESGFSQNITTLPHQNINITWKLDLYLGEQECRHEYDVRAGSGWQREVFRPDGFFRVLPESTDATRESTDALQSASSTTRSFFVEIDLGHTSHAELARKIAVHRRYQESGLFREVFGEDDFSTLVITTTSKREENLFRLLKEQHADFVVLSTLQAVESGVLNPVWRKVSLNEEDEISLTEGKGAIYETLL